MANAQNDRFGGRSLIQDSNHMSDIPDTGGRFMVQDHDHLAGVSQVQAGDDQSNNRQQGDQGKKSKKRSSSQVG